MKTRLAGMLVLLGLCWGVGTVWGATLTWDGGGGDGNEGWTYNPGTGYKNWTVETALPGLGDAVTIGVTNKSIVDADFTTGSSVADNTVVGSTTPPGATLEIASGKTYTIGGPSVSTLRIAYSTVNDVGTVIVKGSLIVNAAAFAANTGADTKGTLTVTNGSLTVTATGLTVGGAASSNATAVAGPQGTLNIHSGTVDYTPTGGDVKVANAARATGSSLTTVGILDFRAGTLSINGRSLYLGEAGGGGIAIVRGYGKVGKYGTGVPIFRLTMGTVTADGDGVNRDLDLGECNSRVYCLTENSNEDTNGWYAIEKGRLLLPRSGTINSAGSYVFGEDVGTGGASDTDPDMVNSVAWSNIVCPAAITVQGALLAPDRTGLVLPGNVGDTVGVWEFTPSGISTVSQVIVRYDHARAAGLLIPEDNLKLYVSTNGGAWVQLSIGRDTDKNQIKADSVVMPAGTNLFAVGVEPPSVGLSNTTASVIEGNAGTTNAVFVVQLSKAVAYATSVDFATADDTATTANNDYAGTNGTITFNPSVTSRTVTVSVNGDTDDEGDETFKLVLSSPTNCVLGTATNGTNTILNDDFGAPVQPTITNTGAFATGLRAEMKGQITDGSGCSVTFYWGTNDGFADASAWVTNDYFAGPFALNDNVTNSVSGLLPNQEYWYTCFVSNSAGTNWTQPSLAFTSGYPTVQFSVPAGSGEESVTNVSVGLTLSEACAANVSVEYSATGGAATNGGVDYSLSPGSVTFTAGQTTTNIALTVIDDTDEEPAEDIVITLSNAPNATIGVNSNFTYTILASDQPAVPLLASNLEATVSGVSAWLVGSATATGGVDGVVCYWGQTDGTNIAGNWAVTNILTGPFVSGEPFTNAISGLLPNTEYRFTYFASNATDTAWAAPSGTFTSGYPQVYFTTATGSGAENVTNVSVSVSLSEITATNVTVEYSATGGLATAGLDFTLATNRITIAAGQTITNFTLTVIDDNDTEPDEAVIIALSNAVGAVVGSSSNFTYTILANDAPIAYVWDGDGGAGNQGWSYKVNGSNVNWATDPITVPGTFVGDSFTIGGANVTSIVETAKSYALNNTTASTIGGTNVVLKIEAGGSLEIASTKLLYIGGPAAATATGTLEVSGSFVRTGYRWSIGEGAANVSARGVVRINDNASLTSGAATAIYLGTSGVGGPDTGSGVGELYIGNNATLVFTGAGSGSSGYISLGGRYGPTLDIAGIGEGLLDIRGGSLLFGPPSNADQWLKLGGTNALSKGTVQGHGLIGKNPGSNAGYSYALQFFMGAKIIADGGDLDMRDAKYSKITNGVENTTDSGCYAINQGRLLMPWSTPIGAASNYVFGESQEGIPDLDPDLVNSVVWSNITPSVTCSNQGSLLAVDRSGLALPGSTNLTVGVWEFTPSAAITSVGSLIFRYDDARAAALGIAETNLALFRNTGAGWSMVSGATIDETKNQLKVDGLSLPSGSTKFAIGAAVPVIGLRNTAVSVTEGPAATTTNAVFTVDLDRTNAVATTVNFDTANGTAMTADNDYVATNGLLTFAPGETSKVVNVVVNGDAAVEPNETFTFTLSSPTNGLLGVSVSATGTIVNDDAAWPTITNTGATATGVTARMKGLITEGTGCEVTFYWGRVDGLTEPGAWETNATLAGTFDVGATATNARGGLLPNTEYWYTCFVSNSLGTNWAQPSVAFTTLYPTVQFAVPTGSGAESVTNVPVTVSLSEICGTNVTVQYSATGGTATAASDYTLAAGTLTIPAGQTSSNFTLTVIDDWETENAETVILVLSNAVGAVVGTPSNHTYTINANDTPIGYTWDAGGGVNNGWSYKVNGSNVNWATDPTTLPGPNDYFTIGVAGATSVVDGAYSVDNSANHCSVSAAGGLADLRIPTGASLTVGVTNTVRSLIIGNSANGGGVVEVTGGSLECRNILYAGYNADAATGTLTLASGSVLCSNGVVLGRNAVSNGASPVGTLNLLGGSFTVQSGGFTLGADPRASGATAVNVGVLDLRGPTLTLSGDVSAQDLAVGTPAASGIGTVRGYGAVGTVGALAPWLRLHYGSVTADGDGVNRDLDLSAMYDRLACGRENGNEETSGCYAIEKGLLRLPWSRSLSSGDTFVFGENEYASYGGKDYDPDLVNSVVWSNVVAAGAFTNQGALLAPDRTGLSLPGTANQTIGVWEFTPSLAISSVAEMTFRYDHVRAASLSIAETNLALYALTNGAGSWARMTTAIDTNKNQIKVYGLGLPAGTNRFAIAAALPLIGLRDAAISVIEGPAATTTNALFTVQLDRTSAYTTTVVFATADGLASNTTDYAATNGVLSFDPGVTSLTVTVSVNGDADGEVNEDFLLILSDPTNGLLGSATTGACTIVNDDLAAPVATNTGAQVAGVTARMTGTTTAGGGSTVTFYWGRIDGLTDEGSWETNRTLSGTYEAGESFTNAAAGLYPNTEYFYACFASNGVGTNWAQPSGVFTTGYPTVQFWTAAANGPESATNVSVTVSLSEATATNVAVQYSAIGGLATNGIDYTLVPGSVTVTAGLSAASFTLNVIDDLDVEGAETVILGLSNAVGAVVGTVSNFTYTIDASDQPVNYTWDAGGGVNNGWSYQVGGTNVNWAADPPTPPGPNDYFTIGLAGATSVVDAAFSTGNGGNSYVSAASPGATLEIASGKTLSIGMSTPRIFGIGSGSSASGIGTVVVKGDLSHSGVLNVGGTQADAVGTLTITNGVLNKMTSGSIVVAGSAPSNTTATAGPLGVLNIHGGTVNFLIGGSFDVHVGANFRAPGSTLTSVGILDLRGGTLTITNGRSLYVGNSSDDGSVGILRGYGKIGRNPAESAPMGPLFRLRGLGTVTADGDNQNRDLDLGECSDFDCARENAAAETNGWYAVEKGRLLMPAFAITSGGSYSFGEESSPTDYDPDLVNSVVWSNIVYGGGSLTNQGALLALDRTGLTLPVAAAKTIGAWEFTTSEAITSVGQITFRYDHARAAALGLNEARLRVFRNTGSGWSRFHGVAADTTKKQLRIVGAAVPAGTTQWAVGAAPDTTVFELR